MANVYQNLRFYTALSSMLLLAFNCNKKEDQQSPMNSFQINIVHHVSRDDEGQNAVINDTDIKTAMTYLNNNFAMWDIKFKTKEIRFVDNSAWNVQFIKQDDFIDQ